MDQTARWYNWFIPEMDEGAISGGKWHRGWFSWWSGMVRLPGGQCGTHCASRLPVHCTWGYGCLGTLHNWLNSNMIEYHIDETRQSLSTQCFVKDCQWPMCWQSSILHCQSSLHTLCKNGLICPYRSAAEAAMDVKLHCSGFREFGSIWPRWPRAEPSAWWQIHPIMVHSSTPVPHHR